MSCSNVLNMQCNLILQHFVSGSVIITPLPVFTVMCKMDSLSNPLFGFQEDTQVAIQAVDMHLHQVDIQLVRFFMCGLM